MGSVLMKLKEEEVAEEARKAAETNVRKLRRSMGLKNLTMIPVMRRKGWKKMTVRNPTAWKMAGNQILRISRNRGVL